jgi:hypothetical protein
MHGSVLKSNSGKGRERVKIGALFVPVGTRDWGSCADGPFKPYMLCVSDNGQDTHAADLLAPSKSCSFSYINGSKVAAQDSI